MTSEQIEKLKTQYTKANKETVEYLGEDGHLHIAAIGERVDCHPDERVYCSIT